MYAIVVDTNIVRAASGFNDPNLCTTILQTFLRCGYVLAMSKPLFGEWFRRRSDVNTEGWSWYISQFAYQWLIELQNRQRIRVFNLDSSLRPRILTGFSSAKGEKEVEKDMHIILTALSADKRIISNDNKARKYFVAASKWVPPLCELVWPQPLDEITRWLEEGAPAKQVFLLSAIQDDS